MQKPEINKQIKEIQRQFNIVISETQSIPKVDSNNLFEQWKLNKSRFYNAWGNFIYEVPEPVSFELEKESLDSIYNFIIEQIKDFNFHDEVRYFSLLDFLKLNRASFFDNLVTKEFVYHLEKKPIPKGMKLAKALKYFISDKSDLHTIQDLVSEAVQKTKISGHLCLSVHPLDYLSSSINNHKWRSCHALDGEFRSGNLSYMCDSTTLICYIRSDKDVILDGFKTPEVKWNDKKWRMLLFVQPHMIFAGRQYPFTIPKVLETIRYYFIPKITETTPNVWTHWTDETLKRITLGEITTKFRSPMVALSDKMICLDELITDEYVGEPLHYNDLLYSSYYNPQYTQQFGWVSLLANSENTHFNIGSKVKCLCCGDRYLQDSGSMVCGKCASEIYKSADRYSHCYCCHETYLTEEMNTVESESSDLVFVCQECYDKLKRCGVCGLKALPSTLEEININGEIIEACPWCRMDNEEGHLSLIVDGNNNAPIYFNLINNSYIIPTEELSNERNE